MKKKALFSILGIMAVGAGLVASLTACNAGDTVSNIVSGVEEVYSEVASAVVSEVGVIGEGFAHIGQDIGNMFGKMFSEPAADATLEEQAEYLFGKHLYLMMRVFELDHLNLVDNESVPEDGYVKVESNVFADYSKLKEFVESTYSQNVASYFLNEYRYEGNPMYIDRDGDIYFDANQAGGKGYYVNWQGATFEIVNSTDNEVTFKAHATVEWPAEEPVEEPYEVECTMVKENGAWRLSTTNY